MTQRVFEFKEASISEAGEFSGYGAVYGNVDDGGDEIAPGAMSEALDDFLKSGFISAGHDWQGQPLGFPTNASEDQGGLYLSGRFHSTPQAQEWRTIAQERLAAGKTMGLSIGYDDVTAKRLPDRRQITKIGRLFEVGFVMVPMNQEAGVAQVKSGDGKSASRNAADAAYVVMTLNALIESESIDAAAGDTADTVDVETLVAARDAVLSFLGDESLQVGTDADLEAVAAEAAAQAEAWGYAYMGRKMPFGEMIRNTAVGVKSIVTRADAIGRLRKEGRVLSSANLTRLEDIADQISALAATEAALRDLLASAAGKSSDDEGAAIEVAYLVQQARSLGVRI